jgi:ketosteroid isomerase-like protein
MTNLEKVQDIYKAFGEGDIPRILSYLSPAVEWEYGVNSTDVPWLQPRRGPADVASFFAALGAFDIKRFGINRIVASGDLVIGVVELDAVVKATGRPVVEQDEVHLWYFDASGKVVRFRHRSDTHQHQMAYKPA